MDTRAVKSRFGMGGSSQKMNAALEIALRVAPTDLSVLVTGESGVGKEFFPQIIHSYSPRKHGRYVAVNCGAIPEGTIDSELFGHEKGAFTGALDARKGYFEEATGGTIFLDEVADLPLSTQVRLLRVLQTGEFMRVGSAKSHRTDVRVVAATNKHLPELVSAGRFREDLYYRLNTVPISVPPLRERREDILPLFRRFAEDVGAQYRMPVISLDEGARAALESYSWPGNVRQLKNVAEQISAVEATRSITSAIVHRYLPPDSFSSTHLTPSPAGASFGDEREILYRILFDMRSEIADIRHTLDDLRRRSEEAIQTPAPPVAENVAGLLPVHPTTKEDVAREAILKALQRCGGNRRETAAQLFISERTLYRKIKELNIE